jgi:hypothetical protein
MSRKARAASSDAGYAEGSTNDACTRCYQRVRKGSEARFDPRGKRCLDCRAWLVPIDNWYTASLADRAMLNKARMRPAGAQGRCKRCTERRG